MKDDCNRRDFLKAASGAAAVAAAGLTVQSTQAQENKAVSESQELVPGMAAQGKGIRCYVESDYAPLKAALVGNPSAIMVTIITRRRQIAHPFQMRRVLDLRLYNSKNRIAALVWCRRSQQVRRAMKRKHVARPDERLDARGCDLIDLVGVSRGANNRPAFCEQVRRESAGGVPMSD
mgnify:CR=1 FL=1